MRAAVRTLNFDDGNGESNTRALIYLLQDLYFLQS